MRTSHRLVSWFRRGARLSLLPLPWVFGMSVALSGGVLLGGSCSPGSRFIDGDTPMEEADMSIPPLTCTKGRLRCTANRDGTEECDGKTWQAKDQCNTKMGDTCVEGVCRTQCDLVSRGNVGCSFYPVNLWSTSTDGMLGIVACLAHMLITRALKMAPASTLASTGTPALFLHAAEGLHGGDGAERRSRARAYGGDGRCL